jgi:parallel beta-helix repeat protein
VPSSDAQGDEPAADSNTYSDLQTALEAAKDGDTLRLAPGTYTATPSEFVEDLCGNCEEHRTKVTATYGFLIRDKAVHLIGSTEGEVILITNAGYGVMFQDSYGSSVSNLSITGGVRDSDGNATDAAIVARQSRVTISDCRIRDNNHRAEDVVVGIGGIFGREGSELIIADNEISGNGWDGIALYRGATAVINNNIISDGRGAGIGITWDAAAIVHRNRISGYWKGIGTFGDSRAILRSNIVIDNLGWGIIATGTSHLYAANNIIHHNGNCGFAVWSEEATGVITNSIITENGWREEWVCPRVGIWINGEAPGFEIRHNDVWSNAESEYRGIDDLTGLDGNVSVEPVFVDMESFRLEAGSPLIDSGDLRISDTDGSRSDLGIWSGPAAGR